MSSKRLYLMSGVAVCLGVLSCAESGDQILDGAVDWSTESSGIVGGQPTLIEQHPWQISLQSMDGAHICGGSIINDRWIVTAAHCVENNSSLTHHIVAGITRMSESIPESNSPWAQHRDVLERYIHPDYNPDTLNGDIALLGLDSPLFFNSHVQAIPLVTPATAASLTRVGKTVTASGFGLTREGSALPDQLQEFQARIITLAAARRAYPGTDNRVLPMVGAPTQTACKGDSGGPAVAMSAVGARLAGVTSHGVGGCPAGAINYYTRVSSFAGWISQVVENDPEESESEVCDDGLDNDHNAQVDCEDQACRSLSQCIEICDDGVDNDGNGKTDCSDSRDCDESWACRFRTEFYEDQVLTKNELREYGPFRVRQRGRFVFEVGPIFGDALVHARFGQLPTRNHFDCRPKLYYGRHRCELIAPPGESVDVYVTLRGIKLKNKVDMWVAYFKAQD